MINWRPMNSDPPPPKDEEIMCFVPGGMWSGRNPYLVCEYSEPYGGNPGSWLTVDDVCAVQPKYWVPLSEIRPEGEPDDA